MLSQGVITCLLASVGLNFSDAFFSSRVHPLPVRLGLTALLLLFLLFLLVLFFSTQILERRALATQSLTCANTTTLCHYVNAN